MKTKPAKTYHRQPIGVETKGINLRLGRWYLEIGKVVREIWESNQLIELLESNHRKNRFNYGKRGSWSRREINNFLKAMEKRRKDERRN